MEENINIGDFDRLCTLKSPTKSKTAGESPSNTYTEHSKKWAKRETVSINEEIAGRRVSILEKYKYTMHYDPDIDETYRLVDGDVNYNILSVDPMRGKILMQLIAEKVQT